MPVVLITGASTGIGCAAALRLASSGWTVLAGVRDDAAGERLLEEAGATAKAGRVITLSLDVTDAGQIERAAEAVERHTAQAGRPGSGRLDGLVNNAGIGFYGPLELTPLEDLRRQFEVNLFGSVAVTQAMLPALRRARGRIVLMSSIGGLVAVPFTAPYAASKHAIEAVGDTLRVELRSSHVRVALIEPGSVATPIWSKGGAEVERLSIPPELEEQYGGVPAMMANAIRNTARSAIAPDRAAQTIERALTARRMKARYLVGRDARAMLLVSRLLPDLVFDSVLRRATGA